MKLSDLPRPAGSLLNTVLAVGRDPLTTMPRWTRELGDRFMLDVPGLPTLFLMNPEDAHHVLVVDHKSYVKDHMTRMLTEILGNGLLTNEGDSWRRQRRLSQPAFHSKAIAGYGETMASLADRTADRWGERSGIELHTEMMRLTLDIVAQTLFGTDIGDDAERIAHGLEVYTEVYRGVCGTGIRLPMWVPLPMHLRAKQTVKELDEVMYRIIDRHRSSPNPDTLLGMLIAATDEETGTGMDDRQLRDEAITLLMAGHETTANALTFAFYLLSQHPRVEERLHEELDRVVGDRRPGLQDLRSLPYTRAVVNEAMRLYPPAWSVGREAAVDTTLGDLEIEMGTQIWLSQWVMQRDGRWFEDPMSFKPERWLGDLEKRLPKGAFIPFAAGPRVCIGKRFAQMEAELVVATLARRVSLRLDPGERLRLFPSITLRPDHGLKMTASSRRFPLENAA